MWWAQSVAGVGPRGVLTGILNFGESNAQGYDLSYDVVLLAVPTGTVKQGFTFTDLPCHSAESATFIIKRGR